MTVDDFAVGDGFDSGMSFFVATFLSFAFFTFGTIFMYFCESLLGMPCWIICLSVL